MKTQDGKIKTYTFRNREDFNKSVRKLYDMGWRRSGNGNPPNGNEPGTYEVDDNWCTIKILRGEIDLSLGQVEYRKAYGYQVHNHGGHLD